MQPQIRSDQSFILFCKSIFPCLTDDRIIEHAHMSGVYTPVEEPQAVTMTTLFTVWWAVWSFDFDSSKFKI